MSITRKPIGDLPYTTFANALLNDESLSADALGVLVYLLSKPGNWRVLPGPLGKRFGCGRDKIYRIMNELIEAGYAERYQTRDDDTGAFSDRNYMVSNEKTPRPENPEAADSPHTVNPDTVNPQHKRKESTKERKQDSGAYSEEFETKVWQPYPRRANTSKKKAYDLWRMLPPEKQQVVIEAIPLYAAAMAREGRPEDKIKHLQFWLSERVYETVGAATPAKQQAAADWYKTATRDQWERLVKIWRMDNNWRLQWGPAPGKPGCMVPDDLLTDWEKGIR